MCSSDLMNSPPVGAGAAPPSTPGSVMTPVWKLADLAELTCQVPFSANPKSPVRNSSQVVFWEFWITEFGAPTGGPTARRRVSEFLSARKAALTAGIPQAVSRRFEIMRRAGRVEAMREVLNPLVNDIMGIISDIDQAQ